MSDSEQIIRELPGEFVRRMRNWQRAACGIGIGHLKAADYGAVIEGGYRETGMPIIEGEASDTEAALATVPLRYQQAVRQFWAYEGNSMRWHGRKRGIDYHTFESWLRQGHDLCQSAIWKQAQQHRRIAALNAEAFAIAT